MENRPSHLEGCCINLLAMKKLIITSFFLFLLLNTVKSQTKASVTVKIKTPTIGCDACKARIEGYLKRHDGVSFVLVNWRRKETTVKFLTDRIDIEEIKTAIANAGHDADDIPATEDAYKRLPITCKKPKEGGPKKYPNIHELL